MADFSSLEEYKPSLAMVASQAIFAVMNLLVKAAFNQGFSGLVFVVYRQSIAAAALLPALFFAGGGTGNKLLHYLGLNLGNASLASVMSNMTPVTTFVIAASIGLEKVELRSLGTWAKIIGTIVSVAGTMILTFYKGPNVFSLSKSYMNFGTELHFVSYKWVLAVVCLLGSTSCWSLWLILQGVFGSAVCYYLQSWCVSVRGPVYCAVFMPLNTVITVALAAIALREELHVGSLIGTVTIIGGLCIVLWGKAEDLKGDGKEVTQSVGVSEITISIGAREDQAEHSTREPLLVNTQRMDN